MGMHSGQDPPSVSTWVVESATIRTSPRTSSVVRVALMRRTRTSVAPGPTSIVTPCVREQDAARPSRLMRRIFRSVSVSPLDRSTVPSTAVTSHCAAEGSAYPPSCTRIGVVLVTRTLLPAAGAPRGSRYVAHACVNANVARIVMAVTRRQRAMAIIFRPPARVAFPPNGALPWMPADTTPARYPGQPDSRADARPPRAGGPCPAAGADAHDPYKD